MEEIGGKKEGKVKNGVTYIIYSFTWDYVTNDKEVWKTNNGFQVNGV